LENNLSEKTYTNFPKSLREKAIRESTAPGAVRREVAKRLKLGDQTIARWLREDYGTAIPGPQELANPLRPDALKIVHNVEPDPQPAFPPPPPPPQQPELPAANSNVLKLRADLATSQTERDLLKSLLSHYLSRGKPCR
jgi:transposase-like protein